MNNEETVLLYAAHDAMQAGDAETVEAAVSRFLIHISENAGASPSIFSEWACAAENFCFDHDWKNAEACHLHALAIARAEKKPMRVYLELSELSDFYSFLGRDEEALRCAHLALKAAKRSKIMTLRHMALNRVAVYLIKQSNVSKALKVANGILRMLPDDSAHRLPRARAYVVGARCYVRLHKPDLAEGNLANAWLLLEPLSRVDILSGIQSCVASWWDTDATLNHERGNLGEAVVSLRKSVEHRRVVAQGDNENRIYKLAALARALDKLGQALNAIGDVGGAESALAECKLMQRITGLPPSR